MLLVGYLLVRGIRLTSRVNVVLVVITLLTLLVVIGAGITEFDADNATWLRASPGWR